MSQISSKKLFATTMKAHNSKTIPQPSNTKQRGESTLPTPHNGSPTHTHTPDKSQIQNTKRLDPTAPPFFPSRQTAQNQSSNGSSDPSSDTTSQQWRQAFNYTHNDRLNYKQKVRTNELPPSLTANKPWGDEMRYPKQKNTFWLLETSCTEVFRSLCR